MAKTDIQKFREMVWSFYGKHKRPMPWRDNVSPYSIFISEVMLQQTQVSRVIEKYTAFLKTFPTFTALAEADTTQLLAVWQGLGYNRRALYVRQAAKAIIDNHGGVLPDDVDSLDALPGIGYATASSIAAFAYNKPVVFIETNIRRVFIHHFFGDETDIRDEALLPLVEDALPHTRAREWYWALMDYGAYLAKQVPNPNKRSAHYSVQEKFSGSVRQVRGELLRLLLAKPRSGVLLKRRYAGDTRLDKALQGLVREGLVHEKNGIYRIQ